MGTRELVMPHTTFHDLPTDDLHVEVEGREVIVTLPGTRYAATFYKPANSPELHSKHFPVEVDRRSPISQAAFVGKAWKLATAKAIELGWIL
jgi:hypothetical protein